MLKKPARIYSDFASPRERTVMMALKRKQVNQNIMAGLDPKWDEETRILAIRGRRASKAMARDFLEGVKKEDKLMAAYERQCRASKAKKNQSKIYKKLRF